VPAAIGKVKKTLKADHFLDEFYDNIDKVIYVGYD